MRLIDADALHPKATYMHGFGKNKYVMLKDIEHAPTIDPEELRPKGEWKVYWCDTSMIGHEYEACSNCGCEIFDTDKFWNCKYCPNCGAKMRGAAE